MNGRGSRMCSPPPPLTEGLRWRLRAALTSWPTGHAAKKNPPCRARAGCAGHALPHAIQALHT